ncbi:Pst1p [Saccharomyces cerevisiae x Saccharomyces kudriavzevii VIN7]|uniref:Pst1p n=1 Tax=Saccharomyces cerevisiae x Saccharomyces kudriavzevii (strain VIN7) TaxID=1095631 RepID=H0GSM1_SACCK|nr:Pst1p [Saccharomyces cerevisiae x Saccharomyces kudriavzevii VIN7]
MQLHSLIASSALLISSALAATSSTSGTLSSSCTISSHATATAQSDLDKYSRCETLVGNLTIGGGLKTGSLATVKEIKGSLTIFNATNLTSFAADSLQSITDSLNLQSLTILTSASFGSLQSVDSINLITLPAISTFTSNIKSANNIYISDTALQSVDGFSVLKKVNVFNVNNNKRLTSIKSPVETVTDSLQFSFNGNQTKITFDDLVWANNISLTDVHSVSFASLRKINSSLGFINNSISNLNFTKLNTIGQTFSIVSNDYLKNLSFSNLSTIGGALVIANNTGLQKISGLDNLTAIGGTLQVVGNFTALNLDSLKSIKGGADVESKSNNFSCNALKALQKKGGIKGESFVCKNGATSTSVKLSSTSKHQSSQTSSRASKSSSKAEEKI